MKNNYLIILFIFFVKLTFAQDMSLYNRYVGDKEKMPDLYENMTFEDYQMLSRDIKMMDMMYATIVPGYIHFKAKDTKRGYYILAARMTGYAGLTANYIRLNNYNKSYTDMINDPALKTDRLLFFTSLSIIATSYVYDWIHGKRVLKTKQEQIRYKYGIKLKMEKQLSFKENSTNPTISLSINF